MLEHGTWKTYQTIHHHCTNNNRLTENFIRIICRGIKIKLSFRVSKFHQWYQTAGDIQQCLLAKEAQSSVTLSVVRIIHRLKKPTIIVHQQHLICISIKFRCSVHKWPDKWRHMRYILSVKQPITFRWKMSLKSHIQAIQCPTQVQLGNFLLLITV